jgi:hypothetical protein
MCVLQLTLYSLQNKKRASPTQLVAYSTLPTLPNIELHEFLPVIVQGQYLSKLMMLQMFKTVMVFK